MSLKHENHHFLVRSLISLYTPWYRTCTSGGDTMLGTCTGTSGYTMLGTCTGTRGYTMAVTCTRQHTMSSRTFHSFVHFPIFLHSWQPVYTLYVLPVYLAVMDIQDYTSSHTSWQISPTTGIRISTFCTLEYPARRESRMVLS